MGDDGRRCLVPLGRGQLWPISPREHRDSYFHPEEPSYPPEVEDAFQALQQDIARRAGSGEEVPYNSEDFKLVRFHVSSRTRRLEEPRLVLHFAPTTYYRMLATDQRLDVPMTFGGRTFTLRERYGAGVDLRVAPVPELATHWGVGLAVVTADHQLLISERGNTAVDPNIFFPSVAEGATRAKDSDESGAPNHFNTARRGMEEELGVPLTAEELTWLSFGANAYLLAPEKPGGAKDMRVGVPDDDVDDHVREPFPSAPVS